MKRNTAQREAPSIDGRLVVGGRDRAQAGVAEQRHQRRPVPDVHDHDGEPGVPGVGGVVVVEAEAVDQPAAEPDVGAGEDLPDGADHVPRDQQRQGHHHQGRRGRDAAGRHRQGQRDAERDLDREHGQAEDELADQGTVQILVGQHLREPVGADPDPVGGAEDVLERVVDHGHQRDDRAERDQQEHRQDQEPGAVVLRSCPCPAPSADQPAVGIEQRPRRRESQMCGLARCRAHPRRAWP